MIFKGDYMKHKKNSWALPENYKSFFDASSDEEFKLMHPKAYVFLVLLGIAAFMLPAILFLVLVKSDSLWILLGMAGGLVFGVGLFNLVAIIIKQYLGHVVTAASFIIGGVMMLAGWLLCG